jgi:hypothetical protein
MRWQLGLTGTLVATVIALAPPAHSAGKAQSGKAAVKVTWKKTVVDNVFRSEGVGVADVNKDGKLDVVAGEVWYEGPDWKKMHVIRKDVKFDPLKYSESFCCYMGDFNNDSWPDVIVVPFPGKPCYWYENPQNKPGPWKEHLLATSACNETPLYADLLGNGKRVLIMGWQPKGNDNMGQMVYFTPGKDPTKPWDMNPISEPSQEKKEVPGTRKFSHGLGVGDVNRDGKLDVICTDGWWEQPSKVNGKPWKFHPAKIGEACADMHTFDIDGDGKNDVISTSAHQFGLWWHKQQATASGTSSFVTREIHPGEQVFADPRNYKLRTDEKFVLDAINQLRAAKNLPALRPVSVLCRLARRESPLPKTAIIDAKYQGDLTDCSVMVDPNKFDAKQVTAVLEAEKLFLRDWREIGIGVAGKADSKVMFQILLGDGKTPPDKGIVVWEGMKKKLVSQTHALHFVDINGDGKKDLVTGRRWWAHAAKGDPGSWEPAFLFWFEARQGSDNVTHFVPHLIDDDSGVGTQFAVEDIDGDGLPDIIVANKRGVFVFVQVRTKPD